MYSHRGIQCIRNAFIIIIITFKSSPQAAEGETQSKEGLPALSAHPTSFGQLEVLAGLQQLCHQRREVGCGLAGVRWCDADDVAPSQNSGPGVGLDGSGGLEALPQHVLSSQPAKSGSQWSEQSNPQLPS